MVMMMVAVMVWSSSLVSPSRRWDKGNSGSHSRGENLLQHKLLSVLESSAQNCGYKVELIIGP
jgi:hypothetical protein